MESELYWSARRAALFSSRGRFEPWRLQWEADSIPDDGQLKGAREALGLVAGAGRLRRVPVGVIGPKEASLRQMELAEELGAALARSGLQLLCGGKNGVMEAACKGCHEAGGVPIGLLPDDEWDYANPYVTVPIATGIGPARNAIIARASLVLVAIGGGYGTLSEMAYGLHFNRPVFTLDEAPFVYGAIACEDVAGAMERIAGHFLLGSHH